MALGKVAILASAQTELRRAWSSAQHIDLISAVVGDVFKGTGLSLQDVDFIIDSGSDVLDGRSISNCGFLGALGAHHKEEARVEEDGLWAALYGVNKIRSGASSIGLIVAYSKPSESSVDLYWNAQCEPFYQRPVGFGQRAAIGIQAQRYLAEHRLSDADLASLVSTRYADAQAGGGIEIDELPDADAVLGSPNAARPLTELMMARPLDGAIAVLIGREEIARRMSRAPVFVTGMGSSIDSHAFGDRAPGRLASCEVAAKMAFGKAGWSAREADVAEVSGSSVVGELLAIEAIGLAEPGRGHKLGDEAHTAVNRSGGALPADPIMATGLFRLAGGVGMQNNCVFTLEV
jgi:acetyl-CoA C-acetyltransferase